MTQPPGQGEPARNDPPAITLEAIQKLLHDQQAQILNEVNRLIEERIGDSSRTITQTQQNSPEIDSQIGSSVRRDPTPIPPPIIDPQIT